MSNYVINPITPDDANQLRLQEGLAYVADEYPGYPCRQCLLDAAVGDELILVSHDPFTTNSPYRSSSPIFIHAQDCGSPESLTNIPAQMTDRHLSVRSFDHEALMTRGEIIDGTELDSLLTSMFSDPEVETVHVHNASRGCWAASVERRQPD